MMKHKPDYRFLSLLIPATASSVGFFAFGVLAFSFTELTALPANFRTALVLVGSFALAFGAEVGTLSSVVEIYRKGERLGPWDKAALVVSVLATVGAFVLSFATLLGASATWGPSVRLWGPIVLGLLAALDSYGGFMELGLYLHHKPAEDEAAEERARQRIARDLRFALWRAREEAQYRADMQAIATPRNGNADDLRATIEELKATIETQRAIITNERAEREKQAAPSAPRKAEYSDFARLTAGMNGALSKMTAGEAARILEEHRLAPPSANTLREWKRKALEEHAQ